MIIVFGRPILIEEFHVTPIVRHVPEGTVWRDTLSYDRQMIMTEIDVDLPSNLIDQMQADSDIFDIINLDPAEELQSLQDIASGKDPKRLPPEQARGKARALGRARGIPDTIMDEAESVEDTVDLFRRQMYLDQALGGIGLDAPRKLIDEMSNRLKSGGFEIDVTPANLEQEIRLKALKKGAFKHGW